jgi:hypothetical protein
MAWQQTPDGRPTFQEMVDDFHANHAYVFPGADLEQVIEYENRILTPEATPPVAKKILSPTKAAFTWD